MNQIDQLDPRPMWETFAHEIPDRYARSGDLQERLAILDYELDAAITEQVAHVGRLDTLCKVTLKRAWEEASYAFDQALIGGLTIATWNAARRAAGLPEMAVNVALAPDGSRPPFASMASAWAFMESSSGKTLGAGPLTSVVAETSSLALAMGRAAEVRGRARGKDYQGGDVGGFLPVEWMASSPTHAGGSSAKNEDRILMAGDVRRALERSVDESDRGLLEDVVLGVEQRVPAARMVGERRKKVVQYETVRLTYRQAARAEWERRHDPSPRREYTAEELAESEEAIRERIGRAKKAFQKELERCKLVPMQVERATRPPPARPQRVSAFAEGWS